MLKVFIGYDHVEAVAFNALCHSIQVNAKYPVAIIPVMLSQLKGIYTRQKHPKQSNEFSFSRFLVPYLSGYSGYSVFMDCDMLLRADINKILDNVSPENAVSVVKHNHIPLEDTKYLGNMQYKYPRKNWSSVMLFNCGKCDILTPEYVNKASPMQLHQLLWSEKIGGLAKEWNHLVGYDKPNSEAKIAHYTTGGPWFDEFVDLEFEDEWWAYRRDMLNADQLSGKAAIIK